MTKKYRMRKVFISGLLAFSVILSSCDMVTGGKPLAGGNIGLEKGVSTADGEASVGQATPDSIAAALPCDIGLPALRPHSGEQILRRTAYTASYDSGTRLPYWVAWHLTAEHTDGEYGRKGLKFAEDEDVPEPRATDSDYYNSGYDRGHLCPSADCKWSDEAQRQSFLFTNACPQDHGLNAGDWNEMEQQCRRWAREFGSLYIVSGPILYKGKHKTIGRNKVTVPEAFFKVVLCMEGEPKAIGFIYKNTSGNRPKQSYVNTVDEVERITGFDFFPALPDDTEAAVEATVNLSDWGLGG